MERVNDVKPQPNEVASKPDGSERPPEVAVELARRQLRLVPRGLRYCRPDNTNGRPFV